MSSLTECYKNTEPHCDMWSQLLKYAQSFERYAPFKQDMAKVNSNSTSNFKKFSHKKTSHLTNHQLRSANPFIDGQNSHSVENGLLEASQAAAAQDFVNFKLHRATVLHYLEPQYLDMMMQRSVFNRYLGDLSDSGAFFCIGHNDPCGSDDLPLAMVYLENYSRAFQRHLDIYTRTRMIRQRRTFESLYSSMPREEAMNIVYDMVEHGSLVDFGVFWSLFRSVCDDMDTQFFEIVSAREGLFLGDVGKYKACSLDAELGSSQKPMRWLDEMLTSDSDADSD
ncbi:uncharacterized protein LY89DRAFT_740439 [Mollisia scopiformis]|uniref:Uncharacterized protein n=1 Tax=Mollisia scopiformis TaxID=149040 RepID=A0A132BC95_MOLSC|nr:uncharacterized protein LY89DRAFT_740439 [Mollisia scopiformis]KUJ10035.1 hypothetical protein LY89DRAFT_740439 [Mollisia scopiformis]